MSCTAPLREAKTDSKCSSQSTISDISIWPTSCWKRSKSVRQPGLSMCRPWHILVSIVCIIVAPVRFPLPFLSTCCFFRPINFVCGSTLANPSRAYPDYTMSNIEITDYKNGALLESSHIQLTVMNKIHCQNVFPSFWQKYTSKQDIEILLMRSFCFSSLDLVANCELRLDNLNTPLSLNI